MSTQCHDMTSSTEHMYDTIRYDTIPQYDMTGAVVMYSLTLLPTVPTYLCIRYTTVEQMKQSSKQKKSKKQKTAISEQRRAGSP